MATFRVKPSEDRAQKWSLKYNSARIKDIIDGGKEMFYAHAKVAFVDAEQMELAVKQVTDTIGVGSMQMPFYLAFARQIAKATRRYTGESLALKAVTILDRWEGEGLSKTVLEAIRNQVFHIGTPVSP